MPASIAHCPDHGFHEDEQCPVCDGAGRTILSGARRRRLSKYLSGALRHFPEDAGLELDSAGWTAFDSLLDSATAKYGFVNDEAVAGVVATDPKGRFERDGDRVRAAYGHSVEVTLDAEETPVPDTLYHGTAPRNRESIHSEGLEPMGRQQVHLSGSVETAHEVGSRHAEEPIVFEIDAAAMVADGRQITKRGREVYTTDRVPPQYLSER